MKLSVKAELNPTESKDGVLKALENIFPNLEFKEKGGELIGEGKEQNDFAAFKEHLKIQQIRATARSFLEHRVEGDKLQFELNKQAAFMGKVNFVDFEMALGAIQIVVDDKELGKLIEWLSEE